MSLTIGITGHRILDDEHEVRQEIIKNINKILHERGVHTFTGLTSMAVGADTVFADIVSNHFHQKYQVVLPFTIEKYALDFAESERNTLRNAINLSIKEPIILNDSPTKTTNQKNDSYLDAGKHIVDYCDVLIAVWDGQLAAGVGGTGDIVEYALQENKDIFVVEANTRSTPLRNEVVKLYKSTDEKAESLRSKYERLWKLALVLTMVAAFILAITLSLELHGFFMFLGAFLEMICILTAIYLGHRIKVLGLKDDRVNARRNAEKLRLIEVFIEGGIPIFHPSTKESDNGLKEDMNQEIVAIEEKHRKVCVVLKNERLAKLRMGLLIHGQLKYHTSNAKKLYSFLRITDKILDVLKMLFIIGLLLHVEVALLEWQHWLLSVPIKWLHVSTILLCLAVPSLYAGVEAYKHFKEWAHFHRDSEKMIALMNKRREDLRNSVNNLELVAEELRQNMFHENQIWASILIHKHTPGL